METKSGAIRHINLLGGVNLNSGNGGGGLNHALIKVSS